MTPAERRPSDVFEMPQHATMRRRGQTRMMIYASKIAKGSHADYLRWLASNWAEYSASTTSLSFDVWLFTIHPVNPLKKDN